ncbi:MAG: winged helix-turn-helix domain-containing protein [Candidatus Zixiibacteriota bacterium]
MELTIGEMAGKVWSTLLKKEEIALTQLPKMVHEKEVLVYQALGWLAREGKVNYRVDGNKTFVSLIR